MIRKKLLIYTAGAGSREILLLVNQINLKSPEWDVIGFVDEDPEKNGTTVDGYPVFGVDNNEKGNDVYGICGVLDAKVRQRFITEEIEGKGLKCATLIHPDITIPGDFEIGSGSIIMPSCIISYDVKIGKGVYVLWGAALGHGLRVGNYSTILTFACITGGCAVGSRTTIGAGAILNVGVNVGDDCIIGVGTTIIQNVKNRKRVMALPRMIESEVEYKSNP